MCSSDLFPSHDKGHSRPEEYGWDWFVRSVGWAREVEFEYHKRFGAAVRVAIWASQEDWIKAQEESVTRTASKAPELGLEKLVALGRGPVVERS